MSRRSVVFAANMLGLGGTEKGLVNHVLAMDRERWDVRVVEVRETGPRRAQVEAAGVRVDGAEGDPERLAGLLRGADVVHVHRQGNTEPLVPAAARAAGVPVLVESNIFGQVDRSPDEAAFACHFFLSQMCLLRYRREVDDFSAAFHERHRVLYLPLDLDELPARAPDPPDAKAALGLDPDRPVVGRLGRAADLKWRNLLVDMVPGLLERVPEAQVLFVGATPAKEARLRRLGVLDRCLLLEPTLDADRLATFYAACDVVVGAAEIGESQGLVLAEAMLLGIPVVTCSTPWADNAQVEFVDDGRNGFVANHPAPFAEAVADLVLDPARRAAFGAAGREKIRALLDRDMLTRQLEALYSGLLDGNGPPAEWVPSLAEVDGFAAEYERRLRAEYRPLTARERLEARAERVRERAVQVRLQLNGPALRAAVGRLRARRG